MGTGLNKEDENTLSKEPRLPMAGDCCRLEEDLCGVLFRPDGLSPSSFRGTSVSTEPRRARVGRTKSDPS